MKSRPLGSFANALYLIVKALGTKVCGNLVGKSQALIYKWIDPDLDYFPSIDQALRLDREFMRRGLGPPPILSAYSALLEIDLEKENPTDRPEQKDAFVNIARVMNVCGELIREYSARQLRQGDEDGLHLAASCNICVYLHRLRELCASVESGIKSDTTGRVCPIQRAPRIEVRCGLNN